MKIKYILNKKEKDFLVEIQFNFCPNCYSISALDDKFRKKYEKEIIEFRKNGLLEVRENLELYQFSLMTGLSPLGLELQKEVLKDREGKKK